MSSACGVRSLLVTAARRHRFFVAHDAIGAALARKLRPGTRVVSYVYAVPGWTPVETRQTLPHMTEKGTSPLYLYTLPESVPAAHLTAPAVGTGAESTSRSLPAAPEGEET